MTCATPLLRRASAAESAERTKTAHVVVLFALGRVAQDRVRLGDFLEAFSGLGIALIGIRMMLLG